MTHLSPLPGIVPFSIIGFDLDGTLVNSSGDLAAAVNHVLASEGRPLLDRQQVEGMIGGGGRRMLALALAATGGAPEGARLDRLYAAMIDHYAAHIADLTRPFDGVETALDALAAMGARLAVVTNKQEALAVKLLTETGLLRRFETVVGGDSLGPGNAKPSPAPIHAMIKRLGGGSAAFVGDSAHDAEAARAAGVPFVAVAFGYRDRPVEALGADRVIDHYDALIPTLGAMA